MAFIDRILNAYERLGGNPRELPDSIKHYLVRSAFKDLNRGLSEPIRYSNPIKFLTLALLGTSISSIASPAIARAKENGEEIQQQYGELGSIIREDVRKELEKEKSNPVKDWLKEHSTIEIGTGGSKFEGSPNYEAFVRSLFGVIDFGKYNLGLQLDAHYRKIVGDIGNTLEADAGLVVNNEWLKFGILNQYRHDWSYYDALDFRVLGIASEAKAGNSLLRVYWGIPLDSGRKVTQLKATQQETQETSSTDGNEITRTTRTDNYLKLGKEAREVVSLIAEYKLEQLIKGITLEGGYAFYRGKNGVSKDNGQTVEKPVRDENNFIFGLTYNPDLSNNQLRWLNWLNFYTEGRFKEGFNLNEFLFGLVIPLGKKYKSETDFSKKLLRIEPVRAIEQKIEETRVTKSPELIPIMRTGEEGKKYEATVTTEKGTTGEIIKMPSFLTYNNGILSGTPPDGAAGKHDIEIRVKGATNLESILKTTINIEDTLGGGTPSGGGTGGGGGDSGGGGGGLPPPPD